MPKKEKEFAVPKTLGECADAIYTLRQERLALEKQAETVKKKESLVREHIIAHLPKSEATGVAGKIACVTVVGKVIPQAQDWAKIHAYIKKHNAFDLLQRRLSDGAVQERWDNDKEIPGIISFNTVTLSVNKV